MLSASSARESRTRPGLFQPDNDQSGDDFVSDLDNELTPAQAWCLYLSHFLSMWNSRTYEYGAILFIQAAFPGNLLPSSINGIAETVCVLVSSAYLGRWVDRASTRIRPLLLAIFTNRASLVVCCVLWLLVFSSTHDLLNRLLFAAILVLGMVEKVSRMTNILSMERDWVPILANADGAAYNLTHMNTVMRRIDITCKFAAPLAISSVVAVVKPARGAAAIALVSSISVAIEAWVVIKVWKNNSRLRIGKQGTHVCTVAEPLPASRLHTRDAMQHIMLKFSTLLRSMSDLVEANIEGLRYYFSTVVWLPSICVAVLHGSVLAWSGTLITWLLNEHFSLAEVTIAKAVGSILEIGSTVVFPWAVKMLLSGTDSHKSSIAYQMLGQGDSREDDEEEDDNTTEGARHVSNPVHKPYHDPAAIGQPLGSQELHAAVIDVGRWSLSALSFALLPTVGALFVLNQRIEASPSSTSQGSQPSPLRAEKITAIAAVAFWSFLSLSFLGRWTYDLAATQLTQMLVPSTRRAAFGGTEQAVVSMVSLIHWVAAAVWHQQSDFVWLALASAIGVGVATLAFLGWARSL